MATWTVVLEFLPFDTMVLAKSVSKELRTAARLALTTGRYQDVTRALKAVSRVGALLGDGPLCLASSVHTLTDVERATLRRSPSLQPRPILADLGLIWT